MYDHDLVNRQKEFRFNGKKPEISCILALVVRRSKWRVLKVSAMAIDFNLEATTTVTLLCNLIVAGILSADRPQQP